MKQPHSYIPFADLAAAFVLVVLMGSGWTAPRAQAQVQTREQAQGQAQMQEQAQVQTREQAQELARENLEDEATWSPWTLAAREINALGAVRLSEVFRMMPAIETWSSDRYTHRILGIGMNGAHPGGPGVIVDGVTLPAYFLDRVLTESLPVSPGELGSLTWNPGRTTMPGARLAEGTLTMSTPMLTGWHVMGAMAVVNETGDPGPAKHSDARLNNVDRSGPATWMRVGWGNEAWMIQAGLQTDLHHLTDDRIGGRVRRTYSEQLQPVITQFSPFVRVRYERPRWKGHLLAGHSRRKDFIFHESAGWEWPAHLNRSWMAGLMSGDLDGKRVSIHVDASRISLSSRPSFITLPPSTVLEEAAAEASIGSDWAGMRWTAGIGARGIRISQSHNSLSRLLPSTRLEVRRRSGSWRHTVSLRLLRTPADIMQSGSISSMGTINVVHVGRDGGLEIDMTASRGFFPESGQLSEWALAGFDLGDWMSLPDLADPLDVRSQEAGILEDDPGTGGPGMVDSHPAPRSASLALIGHRKLFSSWTGWIEGRVRWFDGQLLQDRIIDQAFGIGPLLPIWNWSSPHSGWLFSRSAGIEKVEDTGIAWRAFLQFYHVSSEGDDVFFRQQTAFPRHRAWIMASDEREGGLNWMARIGFVSAWTWPEYREPARRNLPANLYVDATIGKSLFSGYSKALISLLNLPNRALGNHPAGVREQLAIRLTLSFSTLTLSRLSSQKDDQR